MKLESRRRTKPDGSQHHDLICIAENETESKIVDLLGQPGTSFIGEIRLSDGYGEHYLLVQPNSVKQ